MRVDDRWYRAERATQAGERAYHRLEERYDDYRPCDRTHTVSRERFDRLAERVAATGAPYGAHTVVYRDSGDLLLVYHAGVEQWVVPGGDVHDDESYREAAERELAEEAGVDAAYRGLALLGRVTLTCEDYSVTGVLPVFAAHARGDDPVVADPDGEITDAAWFDDLPADTRDREDLRRWRESALAD